MVAVAPQKAPELSVVVVVYNMRREAPRTLLSLSPGYQRRVEPSDYEVIVVENGSSEPLDRETVEGFGLGFRYVYVENASPSPAAAVNLGASRGVGQYVGILIDGGYSMEAIALASAVFCLAASAFSTLAARTEKVVV